MNRQRKLFFAFQTFLFLLCTATANESESNSRLMPPQKVGTPPSDAYIGLSLLETGEIRHYNYGEQAESGSFYLSSTDGGFTWKRVNISKEIPFADTRSPLTGEYIRLISAPGMGTYAIRTEGGINGNRTLNKVSDSMGIMLKPPVFTRGGTRTVVAGHYGLQRDYRKRASLLSQMMMDARGNNHRWSPLPITKVEDSIKEFGGIMEPRNPPLLN